MTNIATLVEEKKETVRPEGLPEGYISHQELAETDPNFKRTYLNELKQDSPMRIWLDEEASVFVKVRKTVVEEDDSGKLDPKTNEPYKIITHPEVIEELQPRTEYDIDVVNFIRMFGDPYLRFDLEKKPKHLKELKDSSWWRIKKDCLEICRRCPTRQEVTIDQELDGKVVPKDLPSSYKDGTYQKRNKELGLWGKMVKVWILPPDRFHMTIKGSEKAKEEDMGIEDHTWQAMNSIGMELDQNLNIPNKKTLNDEIDKVGEILVSKGLVGKNPPTAMVRSIMKVAQDKYLEKGDGDA